MKQLLALLLCISVCCTICACDASSGRSSSSVRFYYRVADIEYEDGADVIDSETYDAGTHITNLEFLIRKYLSGPSNARLVSPFPDGTELSEVEIKDNTVNLILTNEFADLTGYELTLTCACITLTVLDITQAESVVISAESALLNNTDSIKMDASCIYLLDSATD